MDDGLIARVQEAIVRDQEMVHASGLGLVQPSSFAAIQGVVLPSVPTCLSCFPPSSLSVTQSHPPTLIILPFKLKKSIPITNLMFMKS